MIASTSARLRFYRHKIGMTPDEASARAGIPTARWEAIESGERIPTLGDALGASWALGVPLETVLGTGDVRAQASYWTCPTDAGPDQQAVDEIVEEMAFLAELASELVGAGYLPQ